MKMKQSPTFFHGAYLNLTFFIGRKILKYSNDFYNWHEIKTNETCANLTAFFLIYKEVRHFTIITVPE